MSRQGGGLWYICCLSSMTLSRFVLVPIRLSPCLSVGLRLDTLSVVLYVQCFDHQSFTTHLSHCGEAAIGCTSMPITGAVDWLMVRSATSVRTGAGIPGTPNPVIRATCFRSSSRLDLIK
ncbi:hypothetical protein BDV93DRAFT_235338 [Ceratobasidium sp. AG-I]|nr:hypothetical protein BDV93DRAFT_235338 [Ceratobasidium sp. AG-I]